MRPIDATTFAVLVCLGSLSSIVSAEGSVGCLFSKALCKPKIEWCFDDNAFGRCVPYEDEIESDFHHYHLNGDSLQLLKQELNRLLKLGYRWSHFYTQCVLKALLLSFRYQKEYNENRCKTFSEDESALSYFEENPEEIDPKSVGQVKFTPSVIDPHAEFADEIYIPVLDEAVIPLENGRSEAHRNHVDDFRQALLLKEMIKNKRFRNKNRYKFFEKQREDDVSSDYSVHLNESPGEASNYKRIDPTTGVEFRLTQVEEDSPESARNYGKDLDSSILENLIFTNDKNILKSFSRNYNTPEDFRNGHETKDEVFYPKSNPFMVHSNRLPEFYYYYPEERQSARQDFNGYNSPENDELPKNEEGEEDGVYTEGGVVYLKDDRKGESDPLEESDSLEGIMNAFGNWGFKRSERFDVKKPGPSFNTNNYAFKKMKVKLDDIKESEKERKEKSEAALISNEILSKKILNLPEKKKGGSPMESPSLRRQTTTVLPTKEKESGGNDGEFAYITLKNRVNTWQEGSRIVRKIEEILNLRQNTFYNIRVDQNDVKFKVDSNRVNLNASEITKRIEAIKEPIQRAIGVEVVSTGIRNLDNVPTMMSLFGEDEHQLWILSFLLCGIIAAAAIAGTVFFFIKKHPNVKEKLKNLTQMDSEASKDYQDLCRARMASKTQEAQEKPEENIMQGHRVANLAKEVEGLNQSPSSRSSTSSWSEEPALTNMDISTGHMVLSYMEDHLKNKDRLEQEWIALCAYEAEPCAVTIAIKEENVKKNRYEDVLPYDHARVVLNELSNALESDYINASTITDHDPRNPAYIASQGPLPHTVADFWQMIWEQGSVVTVMLTRLTENGTAMCHRYWPEEGSQLYHIYEVHLVSEHIWCDDYLVRSFYLKNLKTSETRTVTQFHFLSWPENGVPLSTKALLEFRRKVNKSYRGRSCPVVVHCSDGVGRTGTYCLIDMVLNRMAKGAKEIDIAATLEHIRDQRPLMVRTKQQFEFVLMAVAEEVHAILKALPANPNLSPPPTGKPKE